MPDIRGVSPRERVQLLVHHVAQVLVDSTFSACIPALIEGVAAGDFPARLDPELTALALLGPICYSRLMSGRSFDRERARDLVDLVLGSR